MGASQRVSRGFHRLAILLAVLTFLVVAALSKIWIIDETLPWLALTFAGALFVSLCVYGLIRAIGPPFAFGAVALTGAYAILLLLLWLYKHFPPSS
jgi:hypothetical protein